MVRTAFAAAVAAIAFLSAVSGRAQQYGSAADIQEFADALLANNYADIAEQETKAALERGVPDTGGLLSYSLCEITATVALRTADSSQRIAKLKEAVGAYEEYLKKFPSTDKAAEARLKLSEWLRTAGEVVAAQLKKEADATKKEQLKNDGLNFFTKAEVQAKARIEDLKRIHKDKRTDIQNAEMMALLFSVARMPYSKAMLYENRTGVEAQSLLNEAQEALENFDLEYPGEIFAFDARRIIALIMIERGDLKGAEETISYSCDQLAEAATATPGILKDLQSGENDGVRDLFARMFLEKAEFLTKTKKPADWKAALDTTEQLVKLMPDAVKLKDGKAALVIMAEALAEEGQTPKARTVAQQVYDHDPTGEAGLRAREMLDKLGTGGGGAGIDAMVKLLAGTVERKDIAATERLAARILASPEAKAKPEVQAEAMLQLGGLYYNLGFYPYAAVMFAAIADEFPTAPRAPQAKFNEAMSYAKQSQLDGRSLAKYWNDKSREARNDLTKRFGTSKEALDVAWFTATEKRNEGLDAEAADLYLRVPSTSPKYGEAQYEGAAIKFDLASAARLRDKPDEATKLLKESEGALRNAITAFEGVAKNTINARDIEKAKEYGFLSRLRLAGIYIQKEIKKPEEALKLLDEVEAAHKDDKAKLGKVWSLRIKTLNQLGRGKEAADLLESNKELATAETFVMVAADIDRDAMGRLNASEKDPTVIEDMKIAAKFYSRAVDKAAGGSGTKLDWGKTGQRLLFLGARLSNIPDDMSLMAIDPAVSIAEKSTIEHAKKALEMAGPGADFDVDRQRAIAFCAAATGNWLDAISALREVTNKLALFNDKGKLNKEALQQYSRLPDVYQDLGIAHVRAAKGEKAMADTAKDIFVKLVLNSETGSKRYWEARYLHLLALKEGKDYAELDATLDGLARTAPDADNGKYGMKAKIDEIRAFRDKKIINK